MKTANNFLVINRSLVSKEGIMVTKKVLFQKTAFKYDNNIDLKLKMASEE
jgi:hypothetical protein